MGKLLHDAKKGTRLTRSGTQRNGHAAGSTHPEDRLISL